MFLERPSDPQDVLFFISLIVWSNSCYSMRFKKKLESLILEVERTDRCPDLVLIQSIYLAQIRNQRLIRQNWVHHNLMLLIYTSNRL